MSDRMIRVLYDGECPFCASYVRMARLRQSAEVQLLNARDRPDLVADYAARGFSIDDGMIVDLDGRVYFGWEAVWAINTLASDNALLRRIGHRGLLKVAYPVLRSGRNLTLCLLGRKPIR